MVHSDVRAVVPADLVQGPDHGPRVAGHALARGARALRVVALAGGRGQGLFVEQRRGDTGTAAAIFGMPEQGEDGRWIAFNTGLTGTYAYTICARLNDGNEECDEPQITNDPKPA